MPKGYARYALAVMVGINFLNYLDRWVPTAAAPLIQKEFHLNDFQLGALGTAFLLVYAVGALPMGIWADRGIRKNIIGIGVTVWSFATLLSGFTRNFVQLFLSRAIVGVGEASYYPAGTSLLGDYFPKSSRGRAMSVWGAGTAFGIAVGFAGGGLVADAFGWRVAFFMTAIPGLVFGILAFRLREPLRGAAEERGPSLQEVHHASLRTYLSLLRNRTLRYTILSQTLLFFVLASNAFFLPLEMTRRFHLSVGRAGILAGVVVVAGGLIGNLVGGFLSDHRSKTTARGPLEVGIAGFLVGAVFITVGLLSQTLVFFMLFFLVAVISLYLYSGPFTAIGQNVVVPSLRASAVTLTLFIAHLFGDSYSTLAVGGLSVIFKSLTTALLITSPTLLVLAAVAAALAVPTIQVDMDTAEEAWTQASVEALPLPAL